MRKRSNVCLSLAWFIVLWALWAIWQCKILPTLKPSVGVALLDGIAVKSLIWLVFLLPFLINKRESLFLPLDKLFAEPFPWLAALILLSLCTVFLHTVRLLNGLQNTHAVFDLTFIALSLSAGVMEEFSFRGGFFNIQEPDLKFWPAALINGGMFVLFHYPDLLFGGNWIQLLSLRVLLIFVMGILFCWMFQKWRNLALNMTVHTVWNILSYLFCLA